MDDSSISPVLIVDDNNDNLVFISLTVQDFGYKVVTAKDGEEAINVAELTKPRLILMDIAMPKMDGLAAARRLRDDPVFGDTPIVAVTAFGTDGFRRAAAEAGFDGYLTKPIDFERLRRLMNSLLSGRDPSFSAEQSPSLNARKTEYQNPQVLLWRMFCAENSVPLDATQENLQGALRLRWEEVKQNPTHFFRF